MPPIIPAVPPVPNHPAPTPPASTRARRPLPAPGVQRQQSDDSSINTDPFADRGHRRGLSSDDTASFYATSEPIQRVGTASSGRSGFYSSRSGH